MISSSSLETRTTAGTLSAEHRGGSGPKGGRAMALYQGQFNQEFAKTNASSCTKKAVKKTSGEEVGRTTADQVLAAEVNRNRARTVNGSHPAVGGKTVDEPVVVHQPAVEGEQPLPKKWKKNSADAARDYQKF